MSPSSSRSALVTGATSGIGRSVALALAADGLHVLVHGRDAGRGTQVVEEIELAGGSARFLAADLGDAEDVQRLGKEAADVDVLVNNGGFSWFGPSSDLDTDSFDALFASNVRAPYLLVSAIAPRMAGRGGGSIVNLASMAGTVGLSGGAAYGATKAALASLTRSRAAEFSPSGVRVNAIAPGPVYTGGASRENITALGHTTLLDRAAEPSEIAAVISFLASPAASYVTGATFAADGGRTAV